MQKKIGLLFGILFIAVAFINFLNNPVFFRLNVVGNLLLAICFIESMFFGKIGKIIQISTAVGIAGIGATTNDANHLVSVLAMIIAILLSNRYFPKLKNISAYYTIVPLFIALITMWSFVGIGTNVILYGTLTALMSILEAEK